MTEVKDSLKAIQDGLNEPIEAMRPFELDNEVVAQGMANRHLQIVFPPFFITRNVGQNLKDTLDEKEEKAAR